MLLTHNFESTDARWFPYWAVDEASPQAAETLDAVDRLRTVTEARENRNGAALGYFVLGIAIVGIGLAFAAAPFMGIFFGGPAVSVRLTWIVGWLAGAVLLAAAPFIIAWIRRRQTRQLSIEVDQCRASLRASSALVRGRRLEALQRLS